ncbi:DEAD/DEAH box helicase [Hydrogenophaga sp. BPS33]|uniref:DEAD/DEAH box helicase n=1 Tax=Hydrogenophaga sp. BPS33 TaxID=2651974 RepID=UPI0013202091|nr:DEAD/DEAH box helicase [Hydrogenophaga sp. BPS33]QHE85708.1 DEAD/DEAH box helicase [Hydrogenophaga sp. BPS33]
MPFTSLGLAPALAQAAAELGFTAPTPIQSEAIPAVLAGHDVLATAQTGSGKTAAYALPLLQRLAQAEPLTPRRVRTLVVVPTRELAAQAGEVVRSLAQHLPRKPKIAVVFGGVSINPQMMALRGGADVVVATPGRLLDLVAHNALRLSAVEHLVLDEADRLLDLGFADELARVLALLPARRQNLFFSATFPNAVQALANGLLREPLRIDVASAPVEEAVILQQAYLVDSKRRTELLRRLIKTHDGQRVLVFVATQYAAERVAAKLHQGDLFATSFHGGLSQGARQQTLDEFKEKRWDVVVTTDLAARGLHIDQLPVVVNYDLPRSPVDYTHRIGRTGRAGESGLAVSFVTPATEAHWRVIEKRQGLSLPLEVLPGFEPTEEAAPALPTQNDGGIKGKRPSKKDKLRAAAVAAAAAGKPD